MTRHKILLVPLLIWALLMIIPDLWRVVEPLGSFGFYADNDGVVYDVTGPFEEPSRSPASKAGITVGDRLDLSQMRCLPYDPELCGTALATLGGLQFVMPGRSATVHLLGRDNQGPRQVHLTAEVRPKNFYIRAILILCQLAGIAVVLAAAWLVWTRPGPMSWGFFLYVMWFNPGQSYMFYALLQQSPPLLLAQTLLAGIAEAFGYAGLLLFVMRVPNDKPDSHWLWFERTLPAITVLLAVLFVASYGGIIGLHMETLARVAILTGLIVDIVALTILFERRNRQTPQDYQRLRWVIWGCLIGLPAYIIAELGQATTFFNTPWGVVTPSEDLIGLLYLVNGVLCLFVFEAVRRKRVVSVSIPLRRVTILGLAFSIPALLLHHLADRFQENLELPGWTWLMIGTLVLFLISRLHEFGVEIADHFFNRKIEHAGEELGRAMLQATHSEEVDKLLTDEPHRLLQLTSAAVFRLSGGTFKRERSTEDWSAEATTTLPADAPALQRAALRATFQLSEEQARQLGLPMGLGRPVLAVPVATPLHCFGIAFYGAHVSGADLDQNERDMLARLGRDAAVVYCELENDSLRRRLTILEQHQRAAEPVIQVP